MIKEKKREEGKRVVIGYRFLHLGLFFSQKIKARVNLNVHLSKNGWRVL